MDITIRDLIARAKANETVEINTKMAAYLMKNASFENQRAIRKKRWLPYADAMRRGTFNDLHDITIAECGERYYLVNGYHRLTAQLSAGVSCYYGIHFRKVKDITLIQTMYATTDTGVRNKGQRFDAYVKTGLKDGDRNHCITASKILFTGFRYHVVRSQMGLLESDYRVNYEKDIDWYQAYIELINKAAANQQIKKKLCYGIFLALAKTTADYPDYLEFWLEVAKDDGLTQGDPRKSFLNYLRETKLAPTAEAHIYTHNYFARCWNSWIMNKTVKRIGAVPKDWLIGIKNTSYSKDDDYEFNSLKGER